MLIQKLLKDVEKSSDKEIRDLRESVKEVLPVEILDPVVSTVILEADMSLALMKSMSLDDIKEMVKRKMKKEMLENDEKNGKDEQKDKEDEELVVMSVRDEVVLKSFIDRCSKVSAAKLSLRKALTFSKMEDSANFFSLATPAVEGYKKVGISEATILQLEKLGIETLGQFSVSEDIIEAEFDKPKNKISVADKVGLAWLKSIVNERVEERELYQ